jgi:hypothetical protein
MSKSPLADGEHMTSNFSESKNRIPRAFRLLSIGCVAALVAVICVGLIRTHAQESFPLPAMNPPGAKPASPPGAAPAAQTSAQQPGDAASDSKEPKVARQCADLLKMAAELKTEVDKTTKDTLSVAVVRKAGEIEQFAHKVRTAPEKTETQTQ